MTEDEPTWTSAEIVRTLIRMETKLDRMSTAYVPRELHDQQLGQIRETHQELAKWVADIAASLERTSRDLSEAEKAMVTRRSMWQGITAITGAAAVVGAFVGVLVH